LDIGANIGLSSLALIEEFTTVTKIIGIEAEKENHLVLKRNFDYWQTILKDKKFDAIYGVATSEPTHIFTQSSIREDEKLSSSGTFRFNPKVSLIGSDMLNDTKSGIVINDLLNDINTSEKIVCKVDIEGGESYLFEKNTEWLDQVLFLTIEIHDKYHLELIKSSKNLISILEKYDFAVVPCNDILHCYSRKLIGKSLKVRQA
jgi:FkbM family methyltransferase